VDSTGLRESLRLRPQRQGTHLRLARSQALSEEFEDLRNAEENCSADFSRPVGTVSQASSLQQFTPKPLPRRSSAFTRTRLRFANFILQFHRIAQGQVSASQNSSARTANSCMRYVEPQ
jgi:hypothetical protein